MIAPTPSGCSSQVRFELLAGTERFVPAQIGGGRIIFEHAVMLPGTNGELVAHIDDHQQRWELTWEASDAPRRRVDCEFRELAYSAAAE